MIDFIYELYKNDNFTLYLTIALVILIALFVIVLVFGKKDQKLEETKKLQKLELDGFKEEKTEGEKVEVKEEEKTEEVSAEKTEVETTSIKEEDDVNVIVFEPDKEEATKEKETLVIEKEPILPATDFDEEALEKDLTELEAIKKEFNDINVPLITEKEETPVKKKISSTQVFSSVYVNPADAPANLYIESDEEEMELPSLKDEEVKEDKKEEEPLPVIETEEVTEEIPETLKVVEEEKSLLDDISGESYDLKL